MVARWALCEQVDPVFELFDEISLSCNQAVIEVRHGIDLRL